MLKFKRTIAYFTTLFTVLLLFNVPAFATVGISESESNDSVSTATLVPSDNLTQEIGASIQSPGDVDFYKFVPLNSAGYSIETLGTTDTFGYLYDSNMNLLDLSDDQTYPSGTNFELRYELTANNTYYIKATHKDITGTGNYSLKITPVNYKNNELEPNGSFPTATNALGAGDLSTITSEIGIAGDEDFYKLTPGSGGSFSLETVGSIDTYAYLYDSNYNLIALDDDDGEELNMKIIYNLVGRQTYYLKVRHSSLTGTGNYSLKIAPIESVSATDYHGDDFSSATQLTTDNFVQYGGAAINYSSEQDFFMFMPHTDGVYTFKSIGRSNVYGEVYDSNQTLIKSDDNSGPDDNFMIDVPLIANQTYYLKVTAPNGTTGNYGLDIAKGKCLPVPQYLQLPYDQLCWATATSMASSYFNNDTIDRTVDIAKAHAERLGFANYNYPSDFNQQAYLGDCSLYTGPNTPTNLRTITWENRSLHPKDSTTYSFKYNELMKSIDNGYPIMVKVGNAAGGNHMLIIKGYKEDSNGINLIYNDPLDGQEHMSNSIGISAYATYYPYNTELEPNNSIEGADSIWPNAINDPAHPLQGTIGKSGDVDFYELGADQNGLYFIETTGDTDTYGELYDSNGTLVASADNGGEGGNFKIACHLLTYQTYYIKVSHSGSGTGSYTLNTSHNWPS